MGNLSKPVVLDETMQAVKIAILEGASFIADSLSGSSKRTSVIYGFHIDSSESDPKTAVTYIEDAVGMSPAQMDFLNNKFNYGSWANAFFMPRPCMVKYDGTVDYYLDPNDYEKKENGDMSALGDSTLGYGLKYPGNAMMEWGTNGQKIWTKVQPDAGNPKSGSVYISNIKIDEDYTAYPFINNQGDLVNHFYTAIYNGSLTAYTDGSSTQRLRLRSIPRRIVMNSPGGNKVAQYAIPWDDNSTGTLSQDSLTSSSSNGLTEATHEINFALNNNPGINRAFNATVTSAALADLRVSIGWFTEVFADIQLINNLLVLIGKSLNTQDVFGAGNMSGNSVYGASVNNGVLYTGSDRYESQTPQYDVLNKTGLFWGATGATGTAGAAKAVKVFGMENWWGNQFRRYAGHINKSNGTTQNHFIKQTFGTEDGSTVIGYNTDGSGYLDSQVPVPTTSAYIKSMKFLNSVGSSKVSTFLPIEVNTASSSTLYYCDYFWYSSGTRYSLRCGRSSYNFLCGAFYLDLDASSSYTRWDSGAALSFKPVV